MLEREAIKFYYEQFDKFIYFEKPGILPLASNNHYYPIYYWSGAFYFHVDSIVTFCHRFCADKFGDLTRKTMQEAFTNCTVFNVSGNTLRSFRFVSKREFEEIVK